MRPRLFLFCLLISLADLFGQDRTCICNATVIRGDLSPSFVGNVVISSDTIASVGTTLDSLECDSIIDATGKVLTPGFIDLHAHGDPLKQHSFQNFLAMGVTSIVLGMDGTGVDHDYAGPESFDTWVGKVQNSPLELNIIPFLGHNSLLAKYAGDRQLLLSVLRQGLADGAWGMSMGLEYTPGIFESTEDLLPLAKIVGQADKMIMAHIRSEDDDMMEQSIAEMHQMNAFCQAHISHLKVVYGKGQKRADAILKLLENQGSVLSADFYPYLASYTGLGIMFPKWAKTAADFSRAKEERNDELRKYLEDRIEKRNGPEATLICTGPYTGKTLGAVARQLEIAPHEVLMQWGPQYGSAAYFIMDSSLQTTLALDTAIAFSTDGSPTMHHPRGYGTYAKILENWVLGDPLMSLPLAIYKMTKRPATILGLPHRGEIQKGFKADLVLWDPAAIKANASYTAPKQVAAGFDYVWVNGTLVWHEGSVRTNKAGLLLLKQ